MICCQRIFELADFCQLRLSLGERCLGHGNGAATSFRALAPQAQDAPNFIETEVERLRFADQPYLA